MAEPFPRVIYLEPRCAKCLPGPPGFYDERTWCVDDVFPPCSECGRRGLRYNIDRRYLPRKPSDG